MPFSRATKEQALVVAARYCCVCHRYKGVRVEVHHILPEAQGGTDDLDNAIVLCFDCHADAGHYNPKHPRGTKFSQAELRRARHAWHVTVSRQSLSSQEGSNYLYCRYLLCKSFDAIHEIVNGELKHVPVSSPLLLNNEVSTSLRDLIARHPTPYRHDRLAGDVFGTQEGFSKAHPTVPLFQRSSHNLYPYFEALRVPTIDELRDRIAPTDVVTAYLLGEGVPPDQISLALAYEEFCGDGGFQEIYRLRPLWVVLAALTNIKMVPLNITSMNLIDESAGERYRRFFDCQHAQATTVSFPAAPIAPNATVLIPLAILLGPLSPVDGFVFHEECSDISTGQLQVVAHSQLEQLTEHVHKMGHAIWPTSFEYMDSGVVHTQEVHSFDLSNLYTVDRYWEMGSCPHLFFGGRDAAHYVGELFARAPGIQESAFCIVPPAVERLLIAELETEVTTIASLSINSSLVANNVTLKEGESFVTPVSPGDEVTIIGSYWPLSQAGQISPDPWRRNTLVRERLRSAI
jgi:hypothetical protein